MGGAVAVIFVRVVVPALAPEEQGGKHEEAASANQDRGKGEAVRVHRRGGADALILASVSLASTKDRFTVIRRFCGWMGSRFPVLSQAFFCCQA